MCEFSDVGVGERIRKIDRKYLLHVLEHWSRETNNILLEPAGPPAVT